MFRQSVCPVNGFRHHGVKTYYRRHADTRLDAARLFATLAGMNFGSFYFRNSFAGWFYFSPSSWRVRLR